MSKEDASAEGDAPEFISELHRLAALHLNEEAYNRMVHYAKLYMVKQINELTLFERFEVDLEGAHPDVVRAFERVRQEFDQARFEWPNDWTTYKHDPEEED